MSGGHFDYVQFRMGDVADSIEALISENRYDQNVIDQFEIGLRFLKAAKLFTHEIDWLVSGDTCPASFMERLKADPQYPEPDQGPSDSPPMTNGEG